MKRPQIQFENWPRWFATMWPNAQRRWLIVTSYRQFAETHKSMFADIMLRAGAWSPIRESDPFLAGVAEGRRQIAIELVKLAKLDPAELFELTKVERKGERP
ncbi:hypothetical protein [Afipia felis]|uniref:Uncharacterized protein n=3 Tax=Afipia felis TaxID=1035 RepID=A0A380W5N3_AFIFE|nr:hypothetical protein [Afipia felis]EKS26515.1 hypothetical protein HMPREF9697_04031 [Afipia felis ATCC 53690]SUU76163.1 Uncharacterised protein [Afipia felis]SUU84230.1 Uncharacterised protein [Afipia felis]